MWSISRKCDIFVLITCLWPVDDIYQRFVMEPICRTQSVVEPRFSFRQNDFSREMGGFRRDSLLMISATFSDHPHHRMKIAAPIVRQFYEENSAIETTIMHKSLGTLLHIWGIFQFTQVQPLPSPHKQCWTCVSSIFFEFQLCVVWGEGELKENFEKDALFHEGTEKWQKNLNVALLSQKRLTMIVALFSGSEGTRVKFRHPIQN